MRYIIFVMSVMVLAWSASRSVAQETATAPPISADTINQLQSVQQIDFSGELVMPPTGPDLQPAVLNTNFRTGYFSMNDSGSAFIAVDSDGRLYRFDDTGETRFALPLLNRAPDDALFVFQDAALQNGLGLVTYSINDEQHIRYHTLEFYNSQKQHFILNNVDYPPLQVWLDCSNQAD